MQETKILPSHAPYSVIYGELLWASYKANRGYGMSHERLVNIGIGNDYFKEMYEAEFTPAYDYIGITPLK